MTRSTTVKAVKPHLLWIGRCWKEQPWPVAHQGFSDYTRGTGVWAPAAWGHVHGDDGVEWIRAHATRHMARAISSAKSRRKAKANAGPWLRINWDINCRSARARCTAITCSSISRDITDSGKVLSLACIDLPAGVLRQIKRSTRVLCRSHDRLRRHSMLQAGFAPAACVRPAPFVLSGVWCWRAHPHVISV